MLLEARGAAASALRPPCGARDGAAHRRLLRVLRPAAADRRHGADDRRARAAGDRNRNACRSPRRAAACWRATSPRRSICRRSTIPPSMAMRCATAISRPNAETRLAIGGRLTAGSAAARPDRRRPGDPHLHRRADAGRRRHRVHAGGRARRGRCRDRAGGAQGRRQPQACRRGRAQGLGRAAGRPAARRAGRGARRRGRPDDARRCGGACASRCSRPATRSSSPARRAPPRRSTTPTATLLDGMLERLGAECHRSRHPQGRSRRAGESNRGSGARPRSGADLGRRLDRRSRSCAKRGRKGRHAWCSGASPSSPAGRWRWA